MPGAAPMAGGPLMLRDELGGEVERLAEEMAEIELLIQQVAAEAERHEARRLRAEERLAALERDPLTAPSELNEARGNLLTFTRRALLFEAQQQVLEGKLKTLARFHGRLAEIADHVGHVPGGPATPERPPQPPPQQPGGAPPPPDGEHLLRLRSQEDLRRDIVRQLHDGPAQSLANIALQAEIVQRLVGRDEARAQVELGSLRRMVQHALDTTKEFIFDVRPMVLDDLGLGPTLRRSAADRGRRAGIPVEYESRGNERRLSADLESGLFRCVDDAIAGYLSMRPEKVTVRLDWTEGELLAVVETDWPRGTAELPSGSVPTLPTSEDTPPALAAMMAETRSAERQARSAARSLPPERLLEIGERAHALGIRVALRDDGRYLELMARFPA